MMILDKKLPHEEVEFLLIENDVKDLRGYIEAESDMTPEQIKQCLIETVSHWIRERAEDQRRNYGIEELPTEAETRAMEKEIDKKTKTILRKLGLSE